MLSISISIFLGNEGCYSVPSNMQPSLESSTQMSTFQCVEYCYGINKPFAALQISKCYCLDRISGLNKKDSSHCDKMCTGHDMSFCGGDNAINLYLARKCYNVNIDHWTG